MKPKWYTCGGEVTIMVYKFWWRNISTPYVSLSDDTFVDALFSYRWPWRVIPALFPHSIWWPPTAVGQYTWRLFIYENILKKFRMVVCNRGSFCSKLICDIERNLWVPFVLALWHFLCFCGNLLVCLYLFIHNGQTPPAGVNLADGSKDECWWFLV